MQSNQQKKTLNYTMNNKMHKRIMKTRTLKAKNKKVERKKILKSKSHEILWNVI